MLFYIVSAKEFSHSKEFQEHDGNVGDSLHCHALPLTDPVGGGFQNARDGIGYSSPTELRSQIWGYTSLCVSHTGSRTSTPN